MDPSKAIRPGKRPMSYADAIKDNSRQTAPTKPAHSGQKPRPKATEADTFPTLQAASAENTLEQALSPKNAEPRASTPSKRKSSQCPPPPRNWAAVVKGYAGPKTRGGEPALPPTSTRDPRAENQAQSNAQRSGRLDVRVDQENKHSNVGTSLLAVPKPAVPRPKTPGPETLGSETIIKTPGLGSPFKSARPKTSRPKTMGSNCNGPRTPDRPESSRRTPGSAPPGSVRSCSQGLRKKASKKGKITGTREMDEVDYKIEEAILEGEKEAEKKEKDKSAMLRGLERGNPFLWISCVDWDVLIVCKRTDWRLHRHILCAESPWFKERLPPHDPVKHFVEFNCDDHELSQLAHALYFMYHRSYEGSKLWLEGPENPIDGDPIRKNVYMFICGASVDCTSLKDFTTGAINKTADQLAPLAHKYKGAMTAEFYDPLTDALGMLFSQGETSVMEPMRLAMARLIDMVIMYLIRNTEFKDKFIEDWCLKSDIYARCYFDNKRFMGAVLLDRLIGEPGDPAVYQGPASDETGQTP